MAPKKPLIQSGGSVAELTAADSLDFANTGGLSGLPASASNGQPVVHQQLGSGFNPNVIISSWTPGSPVSNSTAEVPVGQFDIGGAGFQALTQWEVDLGWFWLNNSGGSILGNLRISIGGTIIATNENNNSLISSAVNEKSCLCRLRITARTATQVSLNVIPRVGQGITVDNIDQGNHWDHTGTGVVTVPDLNTTRTLLITVQSETASPQIIITPLFASLQEIRPNGSIGGSPGGSTNEVQYRDAAGNFAGAANVEIVSGNLNLGIVANPSPPAANFVATTPIGGENYAHIPAWALTPNLGQVGQVSPFVTLNYNISNWWAAPGAQPLQGQAATTSNTGTVTAAAIALTNVHTRTPRVDFLVTTASTTAVAGTRDAANFFTIGGASANQGGFMLRLIAGPATGVSVASSRFFMGIGLNAAPTDVEPSSTANIVGFGYDSVDANLNLMHRGAGAVTKVDLGANFPVPTADRAALYQIFLNSPPGTTQIVYWAIWNLSNGAIATGTINTNLPTAATLLARRIYSSVGGTSSVIGVAVGASELKWLI